MNIKRNTEAHSCNHCCSGKVSIKYSAGVFVFLLIQHTMCMHHIVICVLSDSTLSHKQHDLKKKVIEQKMCFDFRYNYCLKHSSY